jgi:hypothetical protein
MGKTYDLNQSEIHSNGKTDGIEKIRKDSIIDGTAKTSNSGYILDYYNYSLYS